MRNGVNIRDLNGVEASTSQFPLVGYTVFWRLAGIRVSRPDLEQALQAVGFEKRLPDPPTPRVALRRTLAEWIRAKQRIARDLRLQQDDEDQDKNSGGRRRTLIRVINRAGSDHLVYALVAEDVYFSMLGLSYGTALRILLHKKTGEMICTTDAVGKRSQTTRRRRPAVRARHQRRANIVGSNSERLPFCFADSLEIIVPMFSSPNCGRLG